MGNSHFPITTYEIVKKFGSNSNFFKIAIGEDYSVDGRIELVRQYIKKYGYGPKQGYINENGVALGSLFNGLTGGSYGKELQKEFKKCTNYLAYHSGGTLEQRVLLLRKYVKQFGYLPVAGYINENGCKLGNLSAQLRHGKYGKELQKEFKKYRKNKEHHVRQRLLLLRQYVKKFGHFPVRSYINKDGCRLGQFLAGIRRGMYSKELQKEFKKLICFKKYKVEQKVSLLRQYVKKFGHLPVNRYINENGSKLGAVSRGLRAGLYGKELQKEFKKYRAFWEYKKKLK